MIAEDQEEEYDELFNQSETSWTWVIHFLMLLDLV